jgi:CBS domain-containing protein
VKPNLTVTPNLRLRRVIDETGTPSDHVVALRVATGASVQTIMSRTTYCLRPEVSVRTAAAMLLEERMSGAPVVDAQGRPIGIVSKTDLLRHSHERGDSVEAQASTAVEAGFHATQIDETVVSDVMMPVVFAIADDTTIAAAAALMAGEGIHRLPVLDGTGAVVGILSTLDVVRWVAERAGYDV